MNEENVEPVSGQSGQTQPQNASQVNALSLFAQSGAANDFPVLKAFQEYLEAEQAKSRKRMLGLSIFFVVLLVVVVVTFSIIMAAVINRDQQNISQIATRNQELSDKLLDIALRDRMQPAQPVVNVQPAPQSVQPTPTPHAQPDSLLKPLLEKIEHLATAMTVRQQQPVQPTPVVVTAATPVQQTPVESAESIRLRAELKREREALEAVKVEREKLKVEQEKLRQEKIEQHRRRLYPEYYAREDARRAAEEAVDRVPPPLPSPKTGVKPLDIRTAKPIRYFDEPAPEVKKPVPVPEVKKAAEVRKPVAMKTPEAGKPAPPVRRPPAQKPVQAAAQKKPASPATNRSDVISIGAGGEAIPFYIELPNDQKK